MHRESVYHDVNHSKRRITYRVVTHHDDLNKEEQGTLAEGSLAMKSELQFFIYLLKAECFLKNLLSQSRFTFIVYIKIINLIIDRQEFI